MGDRVVVRKASRSGRIRKWNGIVVSEVDLVEDKKVAGGERRGIYQTIFDGAILLILRIDHNVIGRERHLVLLPRARVTVPIHLARSN